MKLFNSLTIYLLVNSDKSLVLDINTIKTKLAVLEDN